MMALLSIIAFFLALANLVSSFKLSRYGLAKSYNKLSTQTCIRQSMDEMDPEETTAFERIAKNYLISKFKDCKGDDCRLFCDRADIEQLLRAILPPVTPKELENEISLVMKNYNDKNELVDLDEFVASAIKNTFWEKAGSFVVKELIFLDCLYSYYYKKTNLLDDEDYNELKDQLTWGGSVTVTISNKEALFITAVAAYWKKQSILGDEEYAKLKNELMEAKSWIVMRELDPLEKLGLNTFMGYLHRSL